MSKWFYVLVAWHVLILTVIVVTFLKFFDFLFTLVCLWFPLFGLFVCMYVFFFDHTVSILLSFLMVDMWLQKISERCVSVKIYRFCSKHNSKAAIYSENQYHHTSQWFDSRFQKCCLCSRISLLNELKLGRLYPYH